MIIKYFTDKYKDNYKEKINSLKLRYTVEFVSIKTELNELDLLKKIDIAENLLTNLLYETANKYYMDLFAKNKDKVDFYIDKQKSKDVYKAEINRHIKNGFFINNNVSSDGNEFKIRNFHKDSELYNIICMYIIYTYDKASRNVNLQSFNIEQEEEHMAKLYNLVSVDYEYCKKILKKNRDIKNLEIIGNQALNNMIKKHGNIANVNIRLTELETNYKNDLEKLLHEENNTNNFTDIQNKYIKLYYLDIKDSEEDIINENYNTAQKYILDNKIEINSAILTSLNQQCRTGHSYPTDELCYNYIYYKYYMYEKSKKDKELFEETGPISRDATAPELPFLTRIWNTIIGT